MKVKIISYGKYRKTAQVVIHFNGRSQTKHLKKVGDMWLDKDGNSIHV